MNFKRANELLTGRNHSRRKLGNNTYLERQSDSSIAIRLHATNVLTFLPNGDVILDSGGWLTVTTKTRINEYLDQYRIWSDRGVWFLSMGRNQEPIPYADGMVIHADGSISGQGEDPKAALKLKRRIKNYADDFITKLFAGEIPEPSHGDCWFCLMTVTSPENHKGKSLGEANRDTSHLMSHMVEKYYVPSLLIRAIKRFPVSQCANSCLAELWGKGPDLVSQVLTRIHSGHGWYDIAQDQLRKSLKRYLNEQFGMQG